MKTRTHVLLLSSVMALAAMAADAPPVQAVSLAAALGDDWKKLPDWRGVWFLEGPLVFGGAENTMVPPDAKSQPRVIRGVEFEQGVPAGAFMMRVPYKPEFQQQYEATVAKANTTLQSGSTVYKVANTDGWFVGLPLSGTGVAASSVITGIDPDNRTVTVNNAATASGSVTVTGTYNDGSANYWNTAILNRPFAQGQIV